MALDKIYGQVLLDEHFKRKTMTDVITQKSLVITTRVHVSGTVHIWERQEQDGKVETPNVPDVELKKKVFEFEVDFSGTVQEFKDNKKLCYAEARKVAVEYKDEQLKSLRGE